MAISSYKPRSSFIPKSALQPRGTQPEGGGGGGLLGLGFGPDVGLGGVTALKEFGQGMTALGGGLLSLATPWKDGPGAAEFGSALGKGIASSVAGTLDTVDPTGTIASIPAHLWGEEYRGKDFFNKAGERGLLPALIEDIGNVALVGSLATAPVKGAAVASRAAGATDDAARLMAVRAGIAEKPLVRAMQHPYKVAFETFRESAMKPALLAKVGPAKSGTLAESVAESFYKANAERLGLGDRLPVNKDLQADPEVGERIAQFYEDAPDYDVAAEENFRALVEETQAQAKAIQDAGIKLEFTDGDPYASPAEMFKDINENGRLKVFKTKQGEHPFMTPEENDLFRAVHDFFGHSELLNDFSRHGEEIAWANHAQMYSEKARAAMTADLRGQNSWLIFSKHNQARRAAGKDAEFGPQKLTLLPEEFQSRPDAYHALPESQGGKPLGRVQGALARAEEFVQGRETVRVAREQTRIAETARRHAARSFPVRAAARTAEELLLQKARELEMPLSRKDASRIIGSQVALRMEGTKLIEDLARENPKVTEAMLRQSILPGYEPIPKKLQSEAFETALAEIVDAQITEGAKAKQTLLDSRAGATGLGGLADDDAMQAALSPRQKKKLALAQRRLDQASNLRKAVTKEQERIAKQIGVRHDYLGTLAQKLERIDEKVASQFEKFDQSRNWVPKAWRKAGTIEATATDAHARTLAKGGATYLPHEGRFLELGKDEGFMVGLLNKSALTVPLEEFTPQHVQQVIDAGDELFRSTDVAIGTWVDEGLVHIDLSQKVADIDDAMILGAARQQLAVTDLARSEFPDVPLRFRPDIAAEFLSKNKSLKTLSKGIRSALGADVPGAPYTKMLDAVAMQDLLMRQAVAARDMGKVAHPDDFLKQLSIRAGKKPTTAKGALRQWVKRFDPTDGGDQRRLWDEVEKTVADVEKSLLWYNRSHEGIEKLLRDKPNVTLLDGTEINPADLTYQILAATSFSESPRGNLAHAINTLDSMTGPAASRHRDRLGRALAQVSAGKKSLRDVTEDLFPGIDRAGESGLIDALEGKGGIDAIKTANLGSSRKAAMMILLGHTMDKWTPEFMLETFKPTWDIKDFKLDPDKAIRYIDEVHPDFRTRATQLAGEQGPDAVRNQMLREYYGSALYTKVLSFWDNLAKPESSMAVTLDMWMARLFGQTGFESQRNWVDAAEGVRAMARRVSEKYDTQILPHQIQAALWVYVNKELSNQKTGHWLAAAEDARLVIRDGYELTDDIDPIRSWADESAAPYQKDAPDGFQDMEARVQRDGVTQVETISTRKKSPGKNLGIVKKQHDAWLKTREAINEKIRAGDLDGAEDLLIKHTEKTRRKLAGSLDGDANANDFFDLLEPGNMSDATIDALGRVLDRLEGDEGRTLAQAFEDHILGEFIPATDQTKAGIRILESGNLATLVHENGHFLRTVLTPEQMRSVEKAYGVKAGKWAVEAEERFANDFMKYLATGKGPASMVESMGRVRQALMDIWHMVRGTVLRDRIAPELRDIFDSWLDPIEQAIDTPESGIMGFDVPGDAAGATPNQLVTRPPKAFPADAPTGEFYRSGQRGQRALANVERLQAQKATIEATRKQVQKSIGELEQVLIRNETPSQIKQKKYVAQARRLEEQVYKDLGETPAFSRVPARWQPLYQAARNIAKMAEEHPELAGALETLPQTLGEIQQRALEYGYNPAHVRQFTPGQVKSLVFGTMHLGLGRDVSEQIAGVRKTRTGALNRLGGVERSVESFMAAAVEVAVEQNTNAVIDHVEKAVARHLPEGAELPAGWVRWSPTRTFLATGTEVSEKTGKMIDTTPVDTMIIPKSVERSLRREATDIDHWAFTAINKVTSPWRTLVLTLSPGWYVRNIFGNVILAEADGVRLSDWAEAWKSYKNKDEIGHFADIPQVTTDTLAQEAGSFADDSLIPLSKGKAGFQQTLDENGKVRGATTYVQRRLLRLNAVVDEFSRAAVYHKGRRLNMTPEAAWKKASEALVDYGNLSPFERRAVRAVIPFYSWQKGILKVTMNQALDHPARAGILMQLGQMQEDYVADLLGVDSEDVPDYYKHIIGDRNFRGYNPFADPTEIVTPEGITRSMNPFMEIFVRKGLGAPEFFPESFRLGSFGNAEPDVNVPKELGGLLTSSPVGRTAQGDGGSVLNMGLGAQDMDRIRSRILRSRKQIRGIPNPETEAGQREMGLIP